MELKNFFATDERGNILPYSTCYLYQPDTQTPVSGLQSIGGQALANPFGTGPSGLIQFAAPDGPYDLRVVNGNRDYTIRVQCADVEALTARIDNIEIASGYVLLGDYEAGIVITQRNQVFRYDGEYWKVAASVELPYTTTGDWATEYVNFVGVGDAVLRQDIAGNLEAGWYTPQDLVLDGVTDQTAAVLESLNTWKRVRLPAGNIKLDLTVPSGCSLFGAGAKVWDTGSDTWTGSGTLIYGRLKVNDQQGCAAGLMAVDGYALGVNAIEAVGPLTNHHAFYRINTRANDHGWLLESRATTPEAAAFIGNIRIEDCIHYGGPNGFAVKMANVDLHRCYANEVTVQGFVATSDNIIGATTYSRAINVNFFDCGGGGNAVTLRIYSRDHFSLDNSNGVLPAKYIRWVRGDLSGCSEHGAHIGDFYSPTPGFSYINPEDVSIEGANLVLNTLRGVFVSRGTRIRISSNTFGFNGGGEHIDYDTTGERVVDIDYSVGNVFYGGTAGKESGVLDLDNTSGVIDARKGFRLFRTNSTVPLFISSVNGGQPGQRFSVLIQDDYTTVDIDADRPIRGNGTLAEFVFDAKAGAWQAFSINGNYEASGAVAAGVLSMDFSGANTTSLLAFLTENVIGMTVVFPGSLSVGRSFALRLRNATGADKSLTWSTAFQFVDGVSAPASVVAGKTLLLELYWDGFDLIVLSTATY